MTKEELVEKFGTDVYIAVQHVKESYPNYPTKPVKPKLASNSSSRSAFDFAKQLEIFEVEMTHWESDWEKYDASTKKINLILEDYIKDVSGFNEIPEQYKQKVWSRAWDAGHSYGYNEVYHQLCNLVEIFES